MHARIKEVDLSEIHKALYVLNHIPEFDSIFYEKQLLDRLSGSESIVLIAEFAGKPIGCKLAYNRYFDSSVYSWLGGVLPYYRNQGVACDLLSVLERIAAERFFSAIRFKTRNKHKHMLCFALQHGFDIVGFEKRDPLSESRIELYKPL